MFLDSLLEEVSDSDFLDEVSDSDVVEQNDLYDSPFGLLPNLSGTNNISEDTAEVNNNLSEDTAEVETPSSCNILNGVRESLKNVQALLQYSAGCLMNLYKTAKTTAVPMISNSQTKVTDIVVPKQRQS